MHHLSGPRPSNSSAMSVLKMQKGFHTLNFIQSVKTSTEMAFERLPATCPTHFRHLSAEEQNSRVLPRVAESITDRTVRDSCNLSSILEILQTVLGSTSRLGPLRYL